MKTFPFPGHAMLLPEIVRAENCSLFDSDGNRYVDLESGVWCTPLGHSDPVVNQAVTRQMAAIGHMGFCYSNPEVERAAGAVQRLLGHEGGRCTFLCSGSESVEYGVRCMRAALGETVVMSMADSYCGAYGDAASKADGWFVFDWFECADCMREACTDDCPRWGSIPFDTIGGFLFEPGSSSGLVRFPPVRLVRAIAETLREKGGLFMVNEVTTGVGRTGRWFGHQHYGVRPDIAALGKGIGNGYPVSVSSISADVAERLDNTPIPFGSSHFNDATGAAVVCAVVKQIEKRNLIERADTLSSLLLDGLNAIAESRPAVTVRGRGLMAVVDLGLEPDEAVRLHRGLVGEGYICVLRPGTSVLRLDPALTIDEADIHGFLATLERLLDERESQ